MTEIDSKIQAKLGRISKNHTLKRNVSRLRYFYSKIINQSKLHSTQGTSSSSHTDEWIHAMQLETNKNLCRVKAYRLQSSVRWETICFMIVRLSQPSGNKILLPHYNFLNRLSSHDSDHCQIVKSPQTQMITHCPN